MELPRCPGWLSNRVGGWLLLVLVGGVAGCTGKTGTLGSVPPEWRKCNPWGPEALAARASGELQPLFYTQQMAEWAQFARENLQDGDILFRRGRTVCPTSRFMDRVSLGTSDSWFTHDALAFHHGDSVWIYDVEMDPQGVRKIPFEFWMLDTVPGTLTVLRVRPPFRHCIPQVLDYCESVWQRQPSYDLSLRLTDERYYCAELIEKGFRSAGLALSDPIPIHCLPHYRRYWLLKPIACALTELDVNEPVFALGNVWYGTYGSPYLEVVYGGDPRPKRAPPICSPVPMTP